MAAHLDLEGPAQHPDRKAGQAPEQGRVLADPVPNAHPDGERDDHVTGADARQEVAEGQGEVLRPTGHARRAQAAAERDGQRGPALLAAEQQDALIRVTAQQELVEDVLDVASQASYVGSCPSS